LTDASARACVISARVRDQIVARACRRALHSYQSTSVERANATRPVDNPAAGSSP